ncbi:hypothetical protein [Acidovorax carolinensis]|uniref:hypothetical protein n=1 Tax=Acidovorax carolinensis TaxID=553814 RepID=UPI00202B6C40|nr:hypothetical protein [Acidovorax carolinensis]
MRAWTLCAALWCLLLVAPQVQAAQSAPQLLWLTSDITTAPRTAMVQRLAAEAGLGLVHIDYPLAGPAVLDAAQARSWRARWPALRWCGWMHRMPAWRRACAAWWARSSMSAPHAPRAAWSGCLRARPLLTCLRWRLPPAWWPTCRRAARAT